MAFSIPGIIAAITSGNARLREEDARVRNAGYKAADTKSKKDCLAFAREVAAALNAKRMTARNVVEDYDCEVMEDGLVLGKTDDGLLIVVEKLITGKWKAALV